VAEGHLAISHLVTVRRGELALAPLARRPEPVRQEFLKLAGRGGSWCCLFYDEQKRACTIYGHRPLACSLLDCRHPDPLLAVAGRDLLTRFDLIAQDDPLLAVVREHDQACPCPDLGDPAGIRQDLARVTRLVQRDLDLRRRAAEIRPLEVSEELFYFGRPLFHLLLPLGFRVRETAAGLILE